MFFLFIHKGSTGTNTDYESIQKILNQEVLLNKKNHDKEHFLLWLLRNFQQFKDTKQQKGMSLFETQ